MRLTYELEDGHVIAAHEGLRILIDTGSPLTYGATGESIGTIGLPVRALPAELDALLRDNVPGRIDVLLGMDVLSRYAVKIASSRGTLTLGASIKDDHQRDAWHAAMEIATVEGIPAIEVASRRRLKVLFDTGARYSYLPGTSLVSLGTHTDFLVGPGRFQTPLNVIEIGIAGRWLPFSVRSDT
jgi:hypothetical protein